MELQEPWSVRERLVLSHAVERMGNSAWSNVAKAMKKLLGEGRSYTSKDSSREYGRMLDEWAAASRGPATAKKLAEVETQERLKQLESRVAKAGKRAAALMESLQQEPDLDALLRKRVRVGVDAPARQAVPFDEGAVPHLQHRGRPGVYVAPAAVTDSRTLFSVFESVSSHKVAHGIFEEPVTDAIAPGYSRAVKQPMSLSVIRARLHDGSIACATDLFHALVLMLTNALIFNPPETEVHRIALVLMEQVKKECEPLLAIETLRAKEESIRAGHK